MRVFAFSVTFLQSSEYKEIGQENLQIFMFDDEEYTTLGLEPDHSENLVDKNKTGFNPFYYAMQDTIRDTDK